MSIEDVRASLQNYDAMRVLRKELGTTYQHMKKGLYIHIGVKPSQIYGDLYDCSTLVEIKDAATLLLMSKSLEGLMVDVDKELTKTRKRLDAAG